MICSTVQPHHILAESVILRDTHFDIPYLIDIIALCNLKPRHLFKTIILIAFRGHCNTMILVMK